jgi:hypothetical protein
VSDGPDAAVTAFVDLATKRSNLVDEFADDRARMVFSPPNPSEL